MSGATVADFLAYWQREGEIYARSGDYDWMAAQVDGQRILEVGCGMGFGTEALLRRGGCVLAVDALSECLQTAQSRIGNAAQWRQLDVTALSDDDYAVLRDFAPDTVVCWLIGAPASLTGAVASDGGKAVVAYREQAHRAIAEMATALVGVRALHLVDRTAIAWQAKDIGRDTLLRYHLGKTLLNLPWTAERADARYHKLAEGGAMPRVMPGMKGVVPTLASLVARRKD